MADRVDPMVQPVQPACRNAVPDRAAAEAESPELPIRDNAMLSARQLGDLYIARPNPAWAL